VRHECPRATADSPVTLAAGNAARALRIAAPAAQGLRRPEWKAFAAPSWETSFLALKFHRERPPRWSGTLSLQARSVRTRADRNECDAVPETEVRRQTTRLNLPVFGGALILSRCGRVGDRVRLLVAVKRCQPRRAAIGNLPEIVRGFRPGSKATPGRILQRDRTG
jgi:hypothetical protein